MSHERKRDGHRKDKKNARMKEDVAWRHAMAKPPKPSHDQADIQAFKPGAADDDTRHRPYTE